MQQQQTTERVSLNQTSAPKLLLIGLKPLKLPFAMFYPRMQPVCPDYKDLVLRLGIEQQFFQVDRTATSHSRFEHHVHSLRRADIKKKQLQFRNVS